jgi:hypothetical protein
MRFGAWHTMGKPVAATRGLTVSLVTQGFHFLQSPIRRVRAPAFQSELHPGTDASAAVFSG